MKTCESSDCLDCQDICARCGDEDLDSPFVGICTACLDKEIAA